MARPFLIHAFPPSNPLRWMQKLLMVAVLAVAHRKGGLRVRGITPNRTQLD